MYMYAQVLTGHLSIIFDPKVFCVCSVYLRQCSLFSLANPGSRLPAMNGGHTPPLDGLTRRMIALYDYTPAKDSPNPNPEEELAFVAGDVLVISGEADSDGFLQVGVHCPVAFSLAITSDPERKVAAGHWPLYRPFSVQFFTMPTQKIDHDFIKLYRWPIKISAWPSILKALFLALQTFYEDGALHNGSVVLLSGREN